MKDGMMTKWIYTFGDGKAEGAAHMRELLGGKGANLAEMAGLGLPVPPGFTITTEVCTHFTANDETYPDGLEAELTAALAGIEKIMGAKFGDAKNPLLVSVRSGARASMPGMMDTVLNLGLNDVTVAGLAKRSGDERFAYDSYRRFIQMFGDVVLGVDHHMFEDLLEDLKEDRGANLDTDLSADDWKELVRQYLEMVEKELGKPFPQDPTEQLWGAIGAVFGSWMNARAKTYRRLHSIPESWGTAVNVQAMVFGNMGEDCATGVAFTRNPSTGENKFYGEYLVNAQGEDVVAGIRTPQPLTLAEKAEQDSHLPAMEEVMPPRVVKMPMATCMPWMSSGEVSVRTRITSSPFSDQASASSAENTILPEAAPGLDGKPWPMMSRSASGSRVGCKSWSSCPGSTRITASRLVIRPSSTMSQAIFTAALAVRLPVRVCSIQSRPCWMVNSMSCMSL